jgi:hypothetical protein
MSIIGNSFVPVTLNPAAPDVTLAGTIDAYGPLFAVVTKSSTGITGTLILEGAVGGSGAAFDVTNTGTVATSGANSFSTGIILTSPGIVENTGLISGGSGIFMFGSHATGYVRNTGHIEASSGVGVYLYAGGGVNNAGAISGGTAGIYLGGTGGIANTGAIAGETGIIATYAAANISNFGQITGTNTYGVAFQGTLVNAQGALIQGIAASVDVTSGAIYNRGQIGAGGRLGIQIGGALQLRNTGSINGEYAIQSDPQTGANTAIYNAASGRITGIVYGIELQGTAGAYDSIGNAGYIEAEGNSAIYIKSGQLLNTGTIEDPDSGDFTAGGRATVTNDGLMQAGRYGIELRDGGEVSNSGQILGNVRFDNDGAITNTALITDGIRAGYDAAIDVTNSGSIGGFGVFGYGVSDKGGTIVNAGLIDAHNNEGIRINGGGPAATIVDTGSIIGTKVNAKAIDAYGIYLLGAATIINTGLIEGSFGGIVARANATIINSGAIRGLGGPAIDLISGQANRLVLDPGSAIEGRIILNGTLELAAGAPGAVNIRDIKAVDELKIDPGATWAISGATRNGTRIINNGTLHASVAHAALAAAGAVYNNGLIKGGDGVIESGGYLYNAGVIVTSGSTGVGIALTSPGTIINAAGAVIKGATGVSLGGKSVLYNDSAIVGGVTAAGAAAIYNYAGAQIIGGITLADGIIYDAGTVTGTSTAIDFTGSHANRLILTPTANIRGAIELGGGALQLDAGAGPGTLNLSAVTAADTITLAKGAAWDISGTAAATIAVTNNGTIIAPNTLTIEGALTGAGTIALAGSLVLDGDVARGQKIRFTGPNETLYLSTPAAFSGTIQKFAPADTIDLTGIALSGITASSLSAGVLTLFETTGSLSLTFANPASLATETFALFTDGAGTGITLTGAAASGTLTWASYATPLGTGSKPETSPQIQSGWLSYESRNISASQLPSITLS